MPLYEDPPWGVNPDWDRARELAADAKNLQLLPVEELRRIVAIAQEQGDHVWADIAERVCRDKAKGR